MSWLTVVKIVAVPLALVLYRLGGSDILPKGLRRYGVPGVIGLVSALAHNWIGLASVPLFIGAYSIGYGESSALRKLLGGNNMLTRLVVGIAYAVASLPILWGNWWLFGFNMIVTPVWTMLNGSQKFALSDDEEEVGMALFSAGTPIIGA